MPRFLAGLILGLFLTASAFAQSGVSVKQSGSSVNANSVPYWVTNGVIGGTVSAADSPITGFGVTASGSAGICANSARQSTGGWIQLCLGYVNGVPTISDQNYGSATAQGLNFAINGTTVAIPTGGNTFIFGNGPFTTTDVPCFSGTAGLVIDCGLKLSSGTVTSGVWQGTPIAVANGGTGATTAGQAQTNLGLGTMATQNSNAVSVTGGTITGMPTPTNATDVAIKSYVDSTATGLTILAQSRLATAAVLPNTPTYANGTLGVGATLTAGSNTTLTVDGTTANLNDVVLVKNQASAFQNGIYTVTAAGSGAAPWVLTRATYFDQAAEMKAGSYTFITAGSTNINSSWTLQTSVTTVGTDSLTFNQFSSSGNVVLSLGGVTGVIGLGNGLTMSGSNLVNNITAGSGIGITGTSLLTISAAQGSVAVSGASTTYTSGQCFETVERSNSGTVMFDTLPGTSPGVLPANCVVTVFNNDASALLAISAGTGPVLEGKSVFNGFIYLGPGQSAKLQSDGTNYWPLLPDRARLAANTSIFVATTGSDTTGSAISSGTALATTNVAWSFAQNHLDLNGQVLTISHATGNYPQTIVLSGGMVGQNGPASVIIQGNTVTPSSVTMPGTGNAVSFTADGKAQLQLQGVTISSSANQGLVTTDGAIVNFTSNTTGATSGSALTAVSNGIIRIIGNYTVNGNEGVHWNANNGGRINIESAGLTITISGAPAWATAFAFAQTGGGIFFDFTPTFSGASTGIRWAISHCGVITTNGTTLPGSIGGTQPTCGEFS